MTAAADGVPGRPLLEALAVVGRGLRPAHAERLAVALAAAFGPDTAGHLTSLVPTPAFRDSVQRLLEAWQQQPDTSGVAVGAAVAAAAHAHDAARRTAHLELVASGPTSSVIHARRTEQVLLQLVHEAQRQILLVTFGLQMHNELRDALRAATERGVTITVLAEDSGDNPEFHGDPVKAVTGLDVRRLRWPAEKRPAHGAALHAKVVVIDGATALVTSANLTKRAAGDNLEVGVLVRGGDIPGRLIGHINRLVDQDVLRRV